MTDASSLSDVASLGQQLQLVEDGRPVYRQIADQIERLIHEGRLPPGARLPADRALSRRLGLSRTTVVSAYEELKARGLVNGRQGSGTFVARPVGPADSRNRHFMREAGRAGEGAISLAYGTPPLDGLPLVTMTRLLAEVAHHEPEALAKYLPAEGYPPLRHELARLLVGWGVPVRPAELMVLSGSQQGIDLLARLLLRPGDYVAVEAYTYPGALAAFRAAGARLMPLPLDGDGLVVEDLATRLAQYPVRLIYTVPTFQNPTGATLPLARRRALLAVAARQAIPIIEDNPFDQLSFGQPAPPSLKALDRDGLVYALGSASKLLGSGLRLGWLLAPPAMIEQAARLKRAADLHANNLAQVALHRFLSSGAMEAHMNGLRRLCQQRADQVVLALQRHIPEVRVNHPTGGLCLWARLVEGMSSEAVLEEALARGVSFMPGSWFAVNGSDDGSLRLCFADPPAQQLDEAIRRLAAAIEAVAGRTSAVNPSRLNGHPALV